MQFVYALDVPQIKTQNFGKTCFDSATCSRIVGNLFSAFFTPQQLSASTVPQMHGRSEAADRMRGFAQSRNLQA